MLPRLLLIGATVGLLAAPGHAVAGTARVTGSTLEYVSDAGEREALSFYRLGANYYVAPAQPGPGCDPTPVGVYCPASGIAAIDVRLGDADDVARVGTDASDPIEVPVSSDGGDGADRVTVAAPAVTLAGGAGDDELSGRGGTVDGGDGDDILSGRALIGGPGHDLLVAHQAGGSLSGGDGDDFLSVRNGGGDTGECGNGRDAYVADAADELSPDCEERLDDLVAALLGEAVRKLKRLGIPGLLRERRVRVRFRPPTHGGLTMIEPAGARSLRELVLIDDVPDLFPRRTTTAALALTRRGRRVLEDARTYKAKLRASFRVEYSGHEAEVVQRVTLRR